MGEILTLVILLAVVGYFLPRSWRWWILCGVVVLWAGGRFGAGLLWVGLGLMLGVAVIQQFFKGWREGRHRAVSPAAPVSVAPAPAPKKDRGSVGYNVVFWVCAIAVFVAMAAVVAWIDNSPAGKEARGYVPYPKVVPVPQSPSPAGFTVEKQKPIPADDVNWEKITEVWIGTQRLSVLPHRGSDTGVWGFSSPDGHFEVNAGDPAIDYVATDGSSIRRRVPVIWCRSESGEMGWCYTSDSGAHLLDYEVLRSCRDKPGWAPDPFQEVIDLNKMSDAGFVVPVASVRWCKYAEGKSAWCTTIKGQVRPFYELAFKK